MQQYRPSTCGCVIVYQPGKTVEKSVVHAAYQSPDGRVYHTRPCDRHKDVPLKKLWAAVLEEQRAKNKEPE